jgi:hypothetical protein
MKYPKHVMAIKPGYRWESGRHHVGFLRVETDLPLPGSPDHDEKEFAAFVDMGRSVPRPPLSKSYSRVEGPGRLRP